MKRKNYGSEEITLEPDINRAYNRVDWSYLLYGLQQMGFVEKIIKWAMLCVTIVQ